MSSKKSSKPPGTQPVTWPATEISLSVIDARRARLSRAGWELVACEGTIGILTSFLDQATVALDLEAWPPRLLPVVDEWTRDARRAPDGSWALLVGWKEQRVLRWRQGAPQLDVIAMPKKKLGCAALALLGDRVAAIPGPLGHDNKSSPLTCADTLLADDAGTLRPFPFDGSGGKAWELNGGVRTASGVDVVVGLGSSPSGGAARSSLRPSPSRAVTPTSASPRCPTRTASSVRLGSRCASSIPSPAPRPRSPLGWATSSR